jgi:hypothetical protein
VKNNQMGCKGSVFGGMGKAGGKKAASCKLQATSGKKAI